MYQYKGLVTHVVDGDTFDVNIDLGFSVMIVERVRLAEVDTCEINDKDPEKRALALKAKARLEEILLNKTVVLTTVKPNDKYGRYLARVTTVHESVAKGEMSFDLGSLMIHEGLAVPYR